MSAARRGPRPVPVIDRVLARVTTDADGCWLWQGYTDRHGYGRVQQNAEAGNALVHRVTYEHLVGPIPDGLELDHLCRVPRCCNPRHLEPVTHAENNRRAEVFGLRVAAFRAKTHCRNGHEYTTENTHQRTDGRRSCRACKAAWARARRAAA